MVKSNKNFLNNSKESLILHIQDGFKENDELALVSDRFLSTWNKEEHSLYVKITNEQDLQHVLSNVYLKATVSSEDRFITASYVNNKGEVIDLEELSMSPSNNKADAILNYVSSEGNNINLSDVSINVGDVYNIINNEHVVSDNLNHNAGFESTSYEEVDDYSFLNVVNDELVSLNSIKDVESLQHILKESLDSSHSLSIENNKELHHLSNIINAQDNTNNEYQIFLYNTNNASYLEFIGSDNEIVNVQISEADIHSGNHDLDTIFNYVIDNNNHNKG